MPGLSIRSFARSRHSEWHPQIAKLDGVIDNRDDRRDVNVA
jgi:hypothetical protein